MLSYPLNGGSWAAKLGSKYPRRCAQVTACATVIAGEGRNSLGFIHIVGLCYPPSGNRAGVAWNLLSMFNDAPPERANA